MHRRIRPSSIALAFLFCATAVASKEFSVRPDGLVHISILDVGQGDGMFVTGPAGQQVLIDGGPDLSALAELGRRMSFFDRHIDTLVLTHPHLDHVAAFPEILKRYHVDLVIMTGVVADAAPYREMLNILKEEQIAVMIADPAKDIDLGGGLMLDVLWPPPEYAGMEPMKNLNDTSVVTMLRFGNDSMLLTGDMEEAEENELLASGEDLRADILKVGHHGSRSSTSTGFLLAIDPDLAVISAGRQNPFGHPHASTIARLKQFDVETHVTAWEGTIDLTMDGL